MFVDGVGGVVCLLVVWCWRCGVFVGGVGGVVMVVLVVWCVCWWCC